MESQTLMKIAIIGTGGVGGYFGARLAAAGNHVSFVARGAHGNALQENGIRLESINGDLHLTNIHVVDDIGALTEPDLIIVGVKSWQVVAIAPKIAEIMTPHSLVLPLQNGVLAVEELSGQIAPEQVLGGLCRIFSQVIKPGVIKHFGVEPTILFGEQDNTESKRVQEISKVFNHAGIQHVIPEDIAVERWKKFISISLSGLMAVTKTTYGEMRSIPEIRALMFELMHEVWQVARAKGVNVPLEYIDQAAAAFETYRYDATASLTRDVWAGRPSEIEYQNGTVVRFAHSLGVTVPVNRFVYYSILPRERKARKQIIGS